MRVAEIYQSIQGEGRLTGTPSVFVRASGCNLRCWFCDTPYASWTPEGQDWSVQEIVRRVLEWDIAHVVLTGGEPMLFAELIPISEQLVSHGRHVTIETAGTLFLPVACQLMSISPKLASSAPDAATHPRWHVRHEQHREVPEVLEKLIARYDYQLKFVIDQPADVDDMIEYLRRYPEFDASRIYLMPQGIDAAALADTEVWLRPICDQHGWKYCPRRQIEWFGATRCT